MIFIVIFYNIKYHFFYMAKKLTTDLTHNKKSETD